MAALLDKAHADLQEGGRNRLSDACSDGMSLGFSDAQDPRSCRNSTTPLGSDGSVVVVVEVEVDMETRVGDPVPVPEINKKKPHLVVAKVVKNCRICQLSLEDLENVVNDDDDDDDESSLSGAGVGEVPIIIELGCSCKDDLASAHKHCAEAWFKIKGNKICEICGATARNLVGANETELLMEHWNETSDAAAATRTAAEMAAVAAAETRNFWHGHRLLNLVLACVVFAFVISWLFHFNMPS